MFLKNLPYAVLLFGSLMVSSCTYDFKIDKSLNYSDVGDLEFNDINNIKEKEVCISNTNNYLDPDSKLNIFNSFRVFDNYFSVMAKGTTDRPIIPDAISHVQLNNVASTGHNGSISISDAVKLGGIETIKFIDYKYKRTGLLTTEMCIVVYGE